MKTQNIEGTDPKNCPLCKKEIEVQHTWIVWNDFACHDYCVKTKFQEIKSFLDKQRKAMGGGE